MATELEVKYRAVPEQQEAIREAYPDGYTLIRMETVYYDTPGGDLSRLHWTLRCRQENERSVCTLKTPGPGGARNEWELECGQISQAVPALSRLSEQPRLAQFTQEGLVPTCGARFRRLARTVSAEGFTAELALDQGVLVNGQKTLPLCEVEVELKAGSPEAMKAFAAEFAARFGLEPEHRSKFARARALGQEVQHGQA